MYILAAGQDLAVFGKVFGQLDRATSRSHRHDSANQCETLCFEVLDSPPTERTNGSVADHTALFTNRSGSWRWRRVEEEGFHGPTCESFFFRRSIMVQYATPSQGIRENMTPQGHI